jgi:type VI secretion system secreted protein VgrG
MGAKFYLEDFRGHDEVGRLFHYELKILSTKGELPLSELVGAGATVTIEAPPGSAPDQGTIHRNGFLTNWEQRAPEGRFAVYHADLRPGLWFAGLNRSSRTFKALSIPNVVQATLQRWSGYFSTQEKLSKPHHPWEYLVQYEESDLNFCQRLLEKEGIFTYFLHSEGEHTLVLCDDSTLLVSSEENNLGVLDYLPENSPPRTSRIVRQPAFGTVVQPGSFAIKDYDYRKPSNPLDASIPLLSSGQPALPGVSSDPSWAENTQVFEYPGDYTETGTAIDYVRLNMERALAQTEYISGETPWIGLGVGSAFSLGQFPDPSRNHGYFVLRTELAARDTAHRSVLEEESGPDFRCVFRGLPGSLPFLPPRITPKPLIHGYHYAFVVGDAQVEGDPTPEGEYLRSIDCDEYGNVRVQFPWDENQEKSIYIRVSQGWAGVRRGSSQIPHLNDEVLVAFLRGNPERPIIVGRVHNQAKMPPHHTAEHRTQTILRDNTDNTVTLESDKRRPFIQLQTKSGHNFHLHNEPGNEFMHMKDSIGQQVLLDSTHGNMQFYVPGKIRHVFGDHGTVRDITKPDWDRTTSPLDENHGPNR